MLTERKKEDPGENKLEADSVGEHGTCLKCHKILPEINNTFCLVGEIFFILYLIILSLFNYSCLHLPSTSPPTPAKPPSLPCFHAPPWFCPFVLYSCGETFSEM